MHVVLPEPMSHAILRYGYCEMDMSAMLLKMLRSGMVFFDVGAHFGYATLLSAALVGETGQVHAFEPTPSSFEILKSNAAGRENIKINNVAVFSKKDCLSFNDFGIRSSTLNSFFAPRVEQSSSQMPSTVYQVQTTSLDEYVEETGITPNVVKIDAESAELEILMGMKTLLDKAQPAIVMEVGDLPNSTVSSAHLVKFLAAQQYHVYGYNTNNTKGCLQEIKDFTSSKYEPGNRLFVHRSRINEMQ